MLSVVGSVLGGGAYPWVCGVTWGWKGENRVSLERQGVVVDFRSYPEVFYLFVYYLFSLFFVYECFCLHGCLCIGCVLGALGGQKRTLDPWN